MLAEARTRFGTAGLNFGKDSVGLLVQDSFQNAVLEGRCYMVGDSAGGANPSGLSTAPISVCITNPGGSGYLGRIWYAGVSSAVAPAAIQHVWLGINRLTLGAAVTGTALATKNCLVGAPDDGRIKAFTTATLPAAPVVGLVLGQIGTGAITVSMGTPVIGGWIYGAVVLGENTSASFQFSSISGTAANMGSWIWEELVKP